MGKPGGQYPKNILFLLMLTWKFDLTEVDSIRVYQKLGRAMERWEKTRKISKEMEPQILQ